MKLIKLIPLRKMTAAIALVLSVCVLTGCNKRYNTVVSPDEGIAKNSAVTVDGQRSGEVKQVQVKDGQLVAEFDVDRSAEGQIRQGIVRVRNGNVVDLRTTTVDANAQPLPAGAFIPVQSALQHNLSKYTHNRTVLIVAAALVLALLLAVFFGRAFKSGLMLAGLLLFSTVAAWLLHPLLTPYVERLYATTANAGVAATGTQPPSATTVQALQNKLQAILASRPDPQIVAFIAALLVSLLAIACLICLLKRAFVCRSAVCSLVWPAILCLSAATAVAAPSGVSYTRDHLLAEQSLARRWLTDASRDSDSAERFVGGGLIREAAEQLALASFQLDRADVGLEGHAERIGSLKSSPFAYVRSDEQRKLSASYSSVIQQIRDDQEHITTLHKLCGATNVQAAALNIFLVKRQDYRNRIRQGLADGSVVLNELRQLSAFPFALVRSGIVTTENVALCRLNSDGSVQLPTGETVLPDGKTKSKTDDQALAQLKRDTQELRLRMEELRRTQTADTKPVQAPFTNVTVVVVASSPATNAASTPNPISTHGTESSLPASTQEVRRVVATPLVAAPNRPSPPEVDSRTNLPHTMAVSSVTESNAEARASTATESRPSVPPSAFSKSRLPLAFALVGGCIVIVLILVGFAWVATLRGRPYTLAFAMESGETRTEELAALEDILVLGASITRDHASTADPSPRIAIGWRGLTLQPGSIGPVAVNDTPTHRTRRLHPGDRIAVTTEDGATKSLTVLSCERADLAIAAEPVTNQQ